MRQGAIGRSGAALLLLVICAMPASADDLPTRKAGLWEITTGMGDTFGEDAAVRRRGDGSCDADARGYRSPRRLLKARRAKIRDHDDDRRRLHDRRQNQDLAHRHRRQLRQRVHRDGDGQTEGQPAGAPATLSAKWLGPCTADQKPGDMIMPNGMKMNIQSMQNMQKGMVPPGAAGAPPAH